MLDRPATNKGTVVPVTVGVRLTTHHSRWADGHGIIHDYSSIAGSLIAKRLMKSVMHLGALQRMEHSTPHVAHTQSWIKGWLIVPVAAIEKINDSMHRGRDA